LKFDIIKIKNKCNILGKKNMLEFMI